MKTTRKIIQALAYIVYQQPDHKVNSMKAYKLLWLADRYHLRQTGRTITGDVFYALPHGVVPSDAKNVVEHQPTTYRTTRTTATAISSAWAGMATGL